MDMASQGRTAAVQYLRMSTEHQRYSLEAQSAAIAEYASERGYDVIRTYADAGKSGLTLRERTGLQGLLSDAIAPSRDFEAILVLDVSRWGRFQDADQAAHYEYLCREAGAQVIYCAEPFENDGGMVGTIVKHLKRVMAGEYSRELSVKIGRAQQQQARLGFRQGGPMPYGLRRLCVDQEGTPRAQLRPGEWKSIHSDRVTYVHGPQEELRVIRRVFRWYVRERMSFAEIARRLNGSGVGYHTPGGHWTGQGINRMIRNELYAGVYVFNRTTERLRSVRRPQPPEEVIRAKVMRPIIGPRTFARAQELAALGHRRRYTDKQMLDALRRILAREGRLTFKLVAQAEDAPWWETYKQRFGSLKNAFALIGWERPKRRWSRRRRGYWSDDEMLAVIRRLHLKHGYVSALLISADRQAPCVGTYLKRFGSLIAAYRLAGLRPITHGQIVKAAMKRAKRRALAMASPAIAPADSPTN